MASVSYSISNNVGGMYAAQDITKGTSAPGAGSLEVRIDRTKQWTRNEIELALDAIWRYIIEDTSNPIGL